MGTQAGRTGRPWRRIRAQVLAQNRVCALALPGCTTHATTVDHITPLTMGGAPLDPNNLQPACAHCQAVQGAHITNGRRMRASRRW